MRRVLSLWLPMWSIDLVRRRERRSSSRPETLRPDQHRGHDPRDWRDLRDLRNPRDSHNPRDPRNPRNPDGGAERPILLHQTVSGAQIVSAACQRCIARGIVRGMSVAHARALLAPAESEALLLAPRDERRELDALHRLATWALRFAPIVALDPPEGLRLDVTGCRRLFRGEDRLRRQLLAALAGLGIHARAAIAPTYGCAWAIAREFSDAPSAASTAWIVQPESIREVLAPLPVAALRLEPQQVEALADVEVTRISQLLPLPRSQVAARYGLSLLRRLDQALGLAEELFESIRPVEPLRAERRFEGPVSDPEALALAARGLVEEIAALLRTRAQGVRRLVLELEGPDASPLRRSIELARPNRRPGHLWSLVRTVLENVAGRESGDDSNCGSGESLGFECIALTAARVAPLGDEQSSRWIDDAAAIDGAAIDAAELIDALGSRLGAGAVLRPRPVAGHLPEEDTELVSALVGAGVGAGVGALVGALRKASAKVSAAEMVEAPRPTRLFACREQVEVRCKEGRPTTLVLCANGVLGRVGTRIELLVACGPERIEPPWWAMATPRERGAQRRRTTMERTGSQAGSQTGSQTGSRAGSRAGSQAGDRRSDDQPLGPPLRPAHRDYWRVVDEAGRACWLVHEGDVWSVAGAWA